MSKWQIKSLGKNKAEVTTSKVRYIVQADTTSLSVQTFKGRQSIESFFAKHVGHNYRIIGRDRSGGSERRDMYVTEKRVVTRVVMGGSRFKIESCPCDHIPPLVREIRKRKRIKLPHTRAFMKQFRGDVYFRRKLKRRIAIARMMNQPDAIIIACIIWCVSCYFTGDWLDCVLCDLCLETPPKGPIVIA